MVIRHVELLMSRRQIDMMIREDPLEIIPRRRTKIDTAGGGWRWDNIDGVPQPSIEARLIPFKRRMTEFLVNTELGQLPDLPYVLLARHGVDIRRGDLFDCFLGKFEVITLDLSEPEVKTAAQVDYFGGGQNG